MLQIKPIKTERDYKTALKEVEKLFTAKPNTREGDRLDVLVTLIEAYEEEHHKIDFPDPVSAIHYWMESRGLERKDLSPYMGSLARVSEVLNHKRGLSLKMVRELHDNLHIPAEILIKQSQQKHAHRRSRVHH
jgi:HTH-type transcriptional regulator / antitoxin HigA